MNRHHKNVSKAPQSQNDCLHPTSRRWTLSLITQCSWLTPAPLRRHWWSNTEIRRTTVKNATNSGIVYFFVEGKQDVVVASQVSQLHGSCSGFCISWCDLLRNTSVNCNQIPEALKANGYLQPITTMHVSIHRHLPVLKKYFVLWRPKAHTVFEYFKQQTLQPINYQF